MENQGYSWRWRLAQYLELRWWKRYLRRLAWPTYVEAKRRHWRWLLQQVQLEIPPGAKVLEAGCGPAGIFTILDQQEVDAFDPLLSAYQEELPDFHPKDFPYVNFHTAMLERLNAQARYDYLFCLNAINHVAHLPQALQQLHEALKPGGILVLSIDVHVYRLLKYLFRVIPGDALHPQQDGLEDYLRLLSQVGFEIEKNIILKRGWLFHYAAIRAKKNGSAILSIGSHSGNSVKR